MNESKMNRKGMELSINFLIGIIFGVILLGLGLTFAAKILSQASVITEGELPDYITIEADSCVNRGDRVCVPQVKQETPVNKAVIFWAVVNNIYGEPKKFKPDIVFRRGETQDKNPVDPDKIVLRDWVTSGTLREIELENNKYEILQIPIRPPKGTKPGTYTFNINVCFNANDNPSEKCSGEYVSLYSPTQQIIVTVT